jgi:hypothetical protein
VASPEQELKKQFYDIINAEEQISDITLGDIMIPTPIPGVWIHVNLGFEIEDGSW